MDATEVVRTYVRAWHEPEAETRRQLLELTWADDGVYTDPNTRSEGRDALLEQIAAFRVRRPGATIEVRSDIEAFDRSFRFNWAVVTAAGEALAEGVDFGQLDVDGRIALVVGFFGALPPADQSDPPP